MSPRLLFLFATALCACSGNVDVDPPTTGTGGAGGQSTAASGGQSTTSTSAGGEGGAGGDVFTGGAGGAMTTSTGGGGPACSGGLIHLDVDPNDDQWPSLTFDTSCPDAPPGEGASGVIGYLGKGSPPLLFLDGCTMPDPPTEPSSFGMWGDLTGAGTTQKGQADLVWFGKQTPSTTDILLEVTDFGPVGGKITGTFELHYMENGQAYMYTGSFDVCRRPDYPPPP